MNRKAYYILLVLFAISVYASPIFFADILSERITGGAYHDINSTNQTNVTVTETTTTTLRTIKVNISSPQTVALNFTSGIEFAVDGLPQKIFLRYIGPNFVTFKISSVFMGVNLFDTKNVDITNDGKYDVKLTLNNLTEDTAGLTIQQYQDTSSPIANTPSTTYYQPPTATFAPPTTLNYPQSTCYDNKQNQGEQGIDCGGPCLQCKKQLFPISISLFPASITELPIPLTLIIALLTVLISLIAVYIIYSRAIKYKKKYFIEGKQPAPMQMPQLQPVQLQPMIELPKIRLEEPQIIKPALPEKPAKELIGYVRANIKEFSRKEIESELLRAGWAKEQIDSAFKAIRVEQDIARLKMFIRASIQKGYTKEQIKKALLTKGWKKDVLDKVLSEQQNT